MHKSTVTTTSVIYCLNTTLVSSTPWQIKLPIIVQKCERISSYNIKLNMCVTVQIDAKTQMAWWRND